MNDNSITESYLAEARAMAKGKSDDSVEMVDFKEQLIGYIRDEQKQGFSLKQIHEALIEQGYDQDEIDFAIAYIKTRFKVGKSGTQSTRKKRTDAHHLKTRFTGPVIGFVLLIFAVLVVFYTAEGAQEQHEQKLTELLPYFKLGLDPANAEIISEKEILKRAEPINQRQATSLLLSKRGNLFFDNIRTAPEIMDGVHKTVTLYTISEGDSISQKTMVELRARVKAPSQTLKILEVIPKNLLDSTDKVRINSGLIVEKDPILQWSYVDVKQGQNIVIRYIIDQEIEDFQSFTIPVVQKELQPTSPTQCGNSLCEIGESYLTCCSDCGCLPTFDCKENLCIAKPKDLCQVDAECDDDDVSTEDTCEGHPARCVNTPITECRHGDHYCPEGCEYETDVDCTAPDVFQPTTEPSSGQKFILNKSLPPWDPLFECHEDWWCTDGDSCTTDICNQDTFKCEWEDVTECINHDFCCPTACSRVDDDDC